ncbi:bifunctional peptidase and arginyl-hydroxylase JMJD5-like [Asterias rubens]|uniref:bifunctional peptidase and arginyl-hydroxylase JMJD5-like n=1 Tax=Asterias rubens TaxID=7604 RepID=UPI001455817D|nr:bifunctional peptidase and arginyl-hydroxylase JMJD5-like [Asterias rubens]
MKDSGSDVSPCGKQKVVNIARVSAPTKEEFLNNYFQKDTPVIITDVASSWPAASWSLESIKERAGHNKAFIRQNTSKQDYKIGKAYNIRESSLGDYISDLEVGNARSRNSYLAVQNIKSTFPELEDDVPMPDYIGKIHMGPYLWIAVNGHYEYCHFDPDDGLLVILTGHKRVRLYGCSPAPLYPNPLGSKGRTIQAQVNCDEPDLEEHPCFEVSTCHCGEVNPGEMLYIPAFWWHQVTSVETSISVNFFFGDAGENNFITKAMSITKWDAFSHWLLNIIEQNRSFDSLQLVLAHLPDSLASFLFKEWKDKASREQIEILVQLVMDYLQLDSLPTDEDRMSKNPPPIKIRGLLWRK